MLSDDLPGMVDKKRAVGFTLIELIMVIVVLGVLSIFVAPRFSSKTSFDTLSFHQELKTAIRFAHKLSIASECAVQVTVSSNSYSLSTPAEASCPFGAFTQNVKHPTQSGAYTGAAPSGVTITSFGNFYFTASGAPSSSGTITVNPDGRQIIINALTGYVQ